MFMNAQSSDKCTTRHVTVLKWLVKNASLTYVQRRTSQIFHTNCLLMNETVYQLVSSVTFEMFCTQATMVGGTRERTHASITSKAGVRCMVAKFKNDNRS